MHHGCVRAAIRHRTVLAVAGDRAVHDARVTGAHGGKAEAESFEHTGPEVLEHHIDCCGEPGDERAPGIALQVDGDASLPAVLLREVHRESSDARLRSAGEVALGRFDLDYRGAEIDQRLAARRARQHPREIQHAYTVERSRPGHVMGASRVAGSSVGG